MRERYDQLAKKIVDRALHGYGTMQLEHEIPIVDAQAGDAYFVPLPELSAPEIGDLGRRHAHLGWRPPVELSSRAARMTRPSENRSGEYSRI